MMIDKKLIGVGLVCVAAVTFIFAAARPNVRLNNEHSRGPVDESNIVCTIPADLDGQRVYHNENTPETPTVGPTALTIGPDGTFWIADGLGRRLLHTTAYCDPLPSMKLPEDILGADDVAVTSRGIFVVDLAAVEPQVIGLSSEGSLLSRHKLPSDLAIGASGLAIGERGELLVEREKGANVFQILDRSGTSVLARNVGYRHHGRYYSARPADLGTPNPHVGTLTLGSRTTVVTSSQPLGGLSILGFGPRDTVYVVAEEIVTSPMIEVDQTVRQYSASGTLLGVARVPLSDRYTPVEHGVAVAPDGRVYALVTTPTQLEIRELRFTSRLESIFPLNVPAQEIETPSGVGPFGTTVQELALAPGADGDTPAPLVCRSRDTMMATAAQYVNNYKYLSTTNINASCPGRRKPSYLGAAGTYPSVPYQWGGYSTVSEFNAAMSPGTYAAGDTATDHWVLGCARGIDCSGFVARCWGLGNPKPNVGQLRDHANFCPAMASMLRGDALLKYGSHAILFQSYGSNGIYVYEAVGGADRVKLSYYAWGNLVGYSTARYNHICA